MKIYYLSKGSDIIGPLHQNEFDQMMSLKSNAYHYYIESIDQTWRPLFSEPKINPFSTRAEHAELSVMLSLAGKTVKLNLEEIRLNVFKVKENTPLSGVFFGVFFNSKLNQSIKKKFLIEKNQVQLSPEEEQICSF